MLDLPTPNIPLLRKAVEWAEAEAAKPGGGLWYQRAYAQPTECGTAYCIAGYAIMTALPNAEMRWDSTTDEAVLFVDGERVFWGDTGEQLLGLTGGERDDLFYGGNTIAHVREAAKRVAARVGERL